jgi:hypothetical protein
MTAQLSSVKTCLAQVCSNRTGMVNALWPHDAYPELPTLQPGATVTIADIKGPAVITCLHVTQFRDAAAHRGIVLRIYWDDASQPAIECPLADFFADGLQGKSMCFSTPFMEKVPHAYNCYLPMPFRARARVDLLNETDRAFDGYSYVEYETLPEVPDDYGYLHASWDRRTICIPREKLLLADLHGRGHLVGTNLSITSNEPDFQGAQFIMEGNDEHFIDGESRQSLDYLGTEDYFSFSWGFQQPFVGLQAGITYVNHEVLPFELAVYRFRDANVIRFERSLRVQVNWEWEFTRATSESKARKLREKLDAAGGKPIDIACTVYWYQLAGSAEGNGKPLPSLVERCSVLGRG